MRCENCPALKTKGYEYPESYCSVYPEDEICDFDDGCGCKHPWNAIKKRRQCNEEAEAHQYDGIVEFYQEQQDKEQAVVESLLAALMKHECCMAHPFFDGELRQIDLSIFDGSNESLRCDSLTRQIVFDLLEFLSEKGYKIQRN